MRRAVLPLALLPLLVAQAGAVVFEDATGEAGIDFLHAGYTGAVPWFIEVVGSGACWGDVDHDGHDDLYLVNMRYVNGTGNAAYDPHHELYLNEGEGTFRAAGAAAGVDLRGFGTGCSFADPDGDGDLDLLVSHWSWLAYLENDGEGRFANATARSGLTVEGKCGDIACLPMGTAWADYDRDGDLDVYVANYVDWDPHTNDLGNSPGPYNGQPNLLFRNRGDGTFEDVTAQAGVDDDPGPGHSKSFQPLWFDHDRDGWPDLYIASDTTPNTLFRNHRDGTFTDVAFAAGVDDTRSSMGLDIADWDGDGWPDLFMTHYDGELAGFYRANRDGTYEDLSDTFPSELDTVGWGTGFHDFDLDGDLDLYDVNGHTHPQANWFAQPGHYFAQANGQWADLTVQSGALAQPHVARGSAVHDHDGDGDLDILQAGALNHSARLLRNQGAPGHWLQVELRQGGMNRFAVGAQVEATLPGGLVLHRSVKAGNSFLSQDSMAVHLGLGGATSAVLRVTWPDGAVEEATLDVDQRVRWVRGQGITHDTLAPRTTFAPAGPLGLEGWFVGPVMVTLAAQDRGLPAVSGVALLEAQTSGGPWAPYAAPLSLVEDGVHVVQGKARDHAGNQEPAREAVVRIDATPPSTLARVQGPPGQAGWFVGPIGVALEARDAASGVATTIARLDGAEGWTATTSLQVQSEGVHVVEFRSRDVAGNEEPIQSLEVRIDRRPPEVRLLPLSILGPWGGAVMAWAADRVSGVAEVAYHLDGAEEPAAVVHGPEPQPWVPPPGSIAPGLHAVRVVARDVAGHAAEAEGWLLVLPGA
jgi:enediyne biosynthesis protein E4